MATVSESAGNQSAIQATLDQGVEALSSQQTVEFTKYTKVVVAPDSFVFWVATPQTKVVKGSLHYATDRVQEEDQTIAVNQVLLTSEESISEFNQIGPTTMWIGAWPIGDVSLQVAFSQQANFYKQADLFHYSGHAVYPAMNTQILASAADIPAGPIVSNSLPIWLSVTSWETGTGLITVPAYPSFAVPDNIVPPYVVAHIEPGTTDSFGNFPLLEWPGVQLPNSGASPLYEIPSSQLVRDEVDLTLFGFTNQMAQQYYQQLIELSSVGPGEAPTFGFANAPAIRDAKRTQVEIAALAMKKTLRISANYYQATANAFAYRLILQAFMSITPGPLP